MTQMSIGFVVAFPDTVPSPNFLFRLAERAEDLGFDSIAAGDHLVANRPFLEPLTLLTAFATCTSRIKLVTDALLLPLRNPAVLAKTVASLDYLSSGRTILAIGIGGENPKDFEVCGVPLTERGRRADEALVVLRELWSRSSASHNGKFWNFEDVSMEPKPTQRQGPNILVGGRSDKALRRAARYGDGWISYLMTAERHESSFEKIMTEAAVVQRDLTAFKLFHHQHIYVAPRRAKAKDRAISYLSWAYNQSFDHLVDKYCAIGTADDCLCLIERFYEAGARHIILEPTCSTEELPSQLELYAKEILPHFRR